MFRFSVKNLCPLPFQINLLTRQFSVCFPVLTKSSQEVKLSPKDRDDWQTIYKLPSIKHLRLISRFKIYQIGLMAGFCFPLHQQYVDKVISKELFYSAVGGCFGTSLVFIVFSYFATKVIGEMKVNFNENLVKISRLTFNGSRKEDVFDLDSIVPFSDNHEGVDLQASHFNRLYIEDERLSECYFFSLKHGLIKDDLFHECVGIYR
eukprot:TCONS_00067624-protein